MLILYKNNGYITLDENTVVQCNVIFVCVKQMFVYDIVDAKCSVNWWFSVKFMSIVGHPSFVQELTITKY
jgi:hypothetical protein